MVERLVVIGGDAAGMTAASQARRLKAADELEIIAFERGNYTSYSACGIPYYIGGLLGDVEELVVRSPEEFRSKQQIEVRMRHEVTAIDLSAGRVSAVDLDGGTDITEGFDQLLIATGANPARPPVDGLDSEGIFGVQTLDDGANVSRYIEEQEAKRAVVVGGGYIGIEMAEAFLRRGLEVALVEMAPRVMSSLDPELGDLVGEAIEAEGIALYTDERVTGFEDDGGRVIAVTTEHRIIPADIVVLGLGIVPDTALADAAGIELGESSAIKVDRRMATSHEGVWAAGDCAEKFHLISRRGVAVALGTHANKQGRAAGINIGGGYETFPGVLGTAVSKICELEVARTGLNEREAADAGFDFLTSTVDSTTRAGYFPGSAPIKTKMVVEKVNGRLLGAQVIGREGAAKRIDVIATALWNEMTVDDMLNMDLSYAPPFAPLWDPVLISARKAWQAVEKELTDDR